MTELDEKIARLPAWARDEIKRLKALPSVLADEAASLRRKVTSLEERSSRQREMIEAMSEMFRSAAVGGNEGAKTVVSILEGYELFPLPKKLD